MNSYPALTVSYIHPLTGAPSKKQTKLQHIGQHREHDLLPKGVHKTELLWTAQKGLCCYCEQPMVRKAAGQKGLVHAAGGKVHSRAATIEHLNKRADGGANLIFNLALACYECNTGRGDIDWATYKSYKLGELISV